MDLEDFVASSYESVRRALGVALGDAARAEELTQEAFAQAWRKWPSVSAMERPVAWVYVVALNRARRDFRRESRASAVAQTAAGTTDVTDDIAGDLDLRAALGRLSVRQRTAVVLRYLADLTVPEVARAMGCADGTVKSTLHTALERLRVEFNEERDL